MSITKKRPNIILFLADQLRFDALGCYGNNEIHTPNIDSLALNGSTFDNHFIQNLINLLTSIVFRILFNLMP